VIFADPGVKVNGAYYRDVLLTEELLPVMCEISGKTALLHTEHSRQSALWKGRQLLLLSFDHSCGSQWSRCEPG